MKIKKNNIIKINKSTKILLSLFNFFAPITFAVLLINIPYFASREKLLLVIFIGILLGFASLFYCAKKYNNVIVVSEEKISICKRINKKLRVLSSIAVSDIKAHKSGTFYVNQQDNKPIFYTNPSIVSFICLLGPISIFIMCSALYANAQLSTNLQKQVPSLKTLKYNENQKGLVIFSNILSWLSVLAITGIGLLAIMIFIFKLT